MVSLIIILLCLAIIGLAIDNFQLRVRITTAERKICYLNTEILETNKKLAEEGIEMADELMNIWIWIRDKEAVAVDMEKAGS